jgi:hypothetical protein
MTKSKRALGDVALPVTTQAVGRSGELRRMMEGEPGKPSKAGKAGEAGKAGPALGKLTVMAPAALLGRLRTASYWSREPVVDIVRRAVEREVARLEEKHGAEPAPPLRPGRKARPG